MAIKERRPRKLLTVPCERCGKGFTAFRRSARFCSSKCRNAAGLAEKDERGREALIAEFGRKCHYCPEATTKWIGARLDPRLGKKVLLCGIHNIEVTRFMFRIRVPDYRRGYARRVYNDKKIAEEQEGIKQCLAPRRDRASTLSSTRIADEPMSAAASESHTVGSSTDPN